MLTSEVIKHFDNVIGKKNHYMATCPCHDDRKQSLSLTGIEGITLIHCFAGCNAHDILKKVGLTFCDLWDHQNKV